MLLVCYCRPKRIAPLLLQPSRRFETPTKKQTQLAVMHFINSWAKS